MRKVADQERNIPGAVPKRWSDDRKDVQTIIQVTPKEFALNHLSKIVVRGREEPHTDLMVLVLPSRSNSCSCSTRSNLDWSSSGNVSHLIKEEGAAICQLEPTHFGGDRPGKRPFLVAEQLTFKEAGRNGRTVEFHKRSIAPLAPVVDRACKQFLSCAGLT